MGTDVFTAVYKTDELRKKYQNYLAPAAKIWIGGNELPADVRVENIRVSLNLSDAASASFTVTDIYDEKSRGIRKAITALFAVGNTVKIALGYGSELEQVFFGFIYETGVRFGDVVSMEVTAMDVERLMMDNYRERTWKGSGYGKIFEAIMADYKSLVSDVSADSEPGGTDSGQKKEELLLRQKGSDLAMVRSLCRLANKEFMVFGDAAKFTAKKESSPIMTLLWARELISFSQGSSFVNVGIVVRGNIKGESKMIEETRDVSGISSDMPIGKIKTANVITLTDISSADELKTRADKEEETLLEKARTASGICVGMPVLIPGRYVEVQAFENRNDGSIDGSYYLKSVTHSFGSDGFTTELTFGREKMSFYGELLDGGEKPEKEVQKARGNAFGEVTENWDSDHPGMVKVRLLFGDQEQSDLGWVPVAVPYAGKEFGSYLLPEIGTRVVLAFHMGHAKSPCVIGCLWDQTNVLPPETANENNTVKTVITKGGNRITVSDEEGKEKITVKTKGELMLMLDDENQQLSLRDKEGENEILLDAKEKTLTLSAKSKVVVKADGQEMLTADGSGKELTLHADNISISSGQKLELKGQNVSVEGSSTKLSGQNLNVEAQAALALKGNASLKAESSGITEIKGTMVKLN